MPHRDQTFFTEVILGPFWELTITQTKTLNVYTGNISYSLIHIWIVSTGLMVTSWVYILEPKRCQKWPQHFGKLWRTRSLSSVHTQKNVYFGYTGSSNLQFEWMRVCLSRSLHSARNCPAGVRSSPPPPGGLGLVPEMNGSLSHSRHTTQTLPKAIERTKTGERAKNQNVC